MCQFHSSMFWRVMYIPKCAAPVTILTSRNLLRIKVIPDLHLTYSKNEGNWGWY